MPLTRKVDRSLPNALLRAREATLRNFRAEIDKFDLTPPQWRVMRALAEGPALNAAELVELCVLMAPSLSRILKSLSARGLIAPGRALVERVSLRSEAVYAELEQAFGRDRMEQLIDLLTDLRTVAVQVSGRGPAENTRP